MEMIYAKAIAGLTLYLSSRSFQCKEECLASCILLVYSDCWYVYGIKSVRSGVTANRWIPVYVVLSFLGKAKGLVSL